MQAAPSLTSATNPNSSHTIEMELKDLRQLFNSMDPSPFKDKDLDSDAEEFIVSASEEFPPDEPLKMRVYLKEWPAEDPTELIRQAVHNYFTYRARLNDQEFRLLMRRGQASLIIGVLFLIACLLTSKVLFSSNTGTWSGIARESLTIAGWVGMWRPMEIYLYDWWPIRRRGKLYKKLSQLPIEVIQRRTL